MRLLRLHRADGSRKVQTVTLWTSNMVQHRPLRRLSGTHFVPQDIERHTRLAKPWNPWEDQWRGQVCQVCQVAGNVEFLNDFITLTLWLLQVWFFSFLWASARVKLGPFRRFRTQSVVQIHSIRGFCEDTKMWAFHEFHCALHKRVKFTKGRRKLWRMFEAVCCFTGRLENLTCRTSPTAIRIIESTQMLLNFSLWLVCLLRSLKRKSIIFLRPRFGAVKTGCYMKYVNLSAPSFLPCKYPIRILNVARPDKAAVGRPKEFLTFLTSQVAGKIYFARWSESCGALWSG